MGLGRFRWVRRSGSGLLSDWDGPRRSTSRRSAELVGRDEEILAVVIALEPGEVVSYGDVAATAGWPGRARLVGRILATTENAVPWWRVVTSTGRLVPGGEAEQRRLLIAEGVEVAGERVRSAPAGRFSRPRRTRL